VENTTDIPAASLDDLAQKAREASITLFAATEGNHGRAVARMAALMGLQAEIFVPAHLDVETRARIGSEKGTRVTVVDGDYDAAVQGAAMEAEKREGGVLIQDNSFEGYEDVPAWIVEGYATMLLEIEAQLAERGMAATAIVTPVGVGSLAQAVVTYSKGNGRSIAVLTVEPDTAGCLHESLKAGKPVQVTTSTTIMTGLNCATVSPLAWPVLSAGVDASVVVPDWDAHLAVEDLRTRFGVGLGPCGAAGLSGLQYVAAEKPESLGLSADSVVVILGTEGSRAYSIPVKTAAR
jgi:diaminopropionate ammonia-lyase family